MSISGNNVRKALVGKDSMLRLKIYLNWLIRGYIRHGLYLEQIRCTTGRSNEKRFVILKAPLNDMGSYTSQPTPERVTMRIIACLGGIAGTIIAGVAVYWATTGISQTATPTVIPTIPSTSTTVVSPVPPTATSAPTPAIWKRAASSFLSLAAVLVKLETLTRIRLFHWERRLEPLILTWCSSAQFMVFLSSLVCPATRTVAATSHIHLYRDDNAKPGWYAESQQVLEHTAVHPAERAVALGCMAGDEDQRRLRGFRW